MSPTKLTQLRSKTDRQLIAVISRRLDAGCDYARRGQYLQAEKAYDEVRVLLPCVDRLRPSEKLLQLEARLARLGETLEESSGANAARVQTAACL
jgi:hypothetical protein